MEIVTYSLVLWRHPPKGFGEDVVISVEVLERVLDWRLVVNNMKRILRPGVVIDIGLGSILGYLHDYWRYEVDDMRKFGAGTGLVPKGEEVHGLECR